MPCEANMLEPDGRKRTELVVVEEVEVGAAEIPPVPRSDEVANVEPAEGDAIAAMEEPLYIVAAVALADDDAAVAAMGDGRLALVPAPIGGVKSRAANSFAAKRGTEGRGTGAAPE